MKVRIWEYDVPAEMTEEFEREYGPDGSWARLFATAPGFVATRLYADVGAAGRYLTVDRFSDDESWARFRAEADVTYTALGDRLAHLTTAQHELL